MPGTPRLEHRGFQVNLLRKRQAAFLPPAERPELADAVHVSGTGIWRSFSFGQVGGSKRDSERRKEAGLEKEVGGFPKGNWGPGPSWKEKADPGPGGCLAPLSEPHPSE